MIEGYGQEFIYRQIELPLLPILNEMESYGVRVDLAALAQLGEELKNGQEELRRGPLAGVDVGKGGTTGATKHHLYVDLALPILRLTDGGQPSTDDDTLKELEGRATGEARAFVHGLRQLREFAKLDSTYVIGMAKWLKGDRVQYRLHQVGTETGRMSCSDFNLMNIPAVGEFGPRFRQVFIPEDGYSLMAADYSQIEYRVVAVLAQERGLIDAWWRDNATDVHQETANLMGIPDRRRDGKTLNFAILYGEGDRAIGAALGITTKAAAALRKLYWERLPGIARWVKATQVQAMVDGYVETYFGRRNYILIPESSEKWFVEKRLREAVNMPVQGTAADIEKVFMPGANGVAHDYGARMLVMVHDELLFEVPQGREVEMGKDLQEVGEHCVDIGVPLKLDVHYGHSWKEAKGE